MKKAFIIIFLFSFNILISCKTDKNDRLVLKQKYMNQETKMENGEVAIPNYAFHVGKINRELTIGKLSVIEYFGDPTYSTSDEVITANSKDDKVNYYSINVYKQNYIDSNFVHFVFKSESGKFISTFANLTEQAAENPLFGNDRLKLISRCGDADCKTVNFCFAIANRSIFDGFSKFCVVAYEATFNGTTGGYMSKYFYISGVNIDRDKPFSVLDGRTSDGVVTMDIPKPFDFPATNENEH